MKKGWAFPLIGLVIVMLFTMPYLAFAAEAVAAPVGKGSATADTG